VRKGPEEHRPASESSLVGGLGRRDGKDRGLGSVGGDDASEGGEMVRTNKASGSGISARENEGGGGGKE
jgi:hypothetical protein